MRDLILQLLKTIGDSRITGFGLILLILLLLVNGRLVIPQAEPLQERPALTIPVAFPRS